MFALAYVDGGMPYVHVLRVGETLIGRTPACDLIINAPSVSRRHARLRVVGGRVFVRDADSTHGTAVNGVPVIEEQEMASGDTLLVGQVEITLIQDLPESELLSESHQVLGETGNLVRRVDDDRAVTRAAPRDLNAAADAAALAEPRSERRGGSDRRKVDLGRLTGERRYGARSPRRPHRPTPHRDQQDAGHVQPLEKILGRVVELVFDVVPAERAYLLLRDSNDQPLSARVMRNRDGSVPAKVSISRTIVNIVHARSRGDAGEGRAVRYPARTRRQHPVDERPVVHVRAALESERSDRRALLRQPAQQEVHHRRSRGVHRALQLRGGRHRAGARCRCSCSRRRSGASG